MKKHGKYFLAPPGDGSDFKELFSRLAAAGAGRRVDADGFPTGPWTPELLAEEISKIDANRDGVDLRTVQLWFQDNEKGISTDNIRWLARIFGCDDPESTSEWQIELSAAQSQLTTKRRARKKAGSWDVLRSKNLVLAATLEDQTESAAAMLPVHTAMRSRRRLSLASRSEAIFNGSPLNLPSTVFAGAVALGFFSYFLGIHNITYGQPGGTIKQVGFIWAPNWTLLFMVFMPLFFAVVVELVAFWKNEGRSKLFMEYDDGWARKVDASSYTFWAAILICLGFAGLFQWIGVCLTPLLSGSSDYTIDWGTLALVRPEAISVPQAVAFTGFAYLYMCLCFYLFFVGLILLHTLANDFWEIEKTSGFHSNVNYQSDVAEGGLRVMGGIFRCTLLGVLVAICMKLQSYYLTSSGTSVLSWLIEDMFSILAAQGTVSEGTNYSRPTHYSSLLIAFASCVPFFYCSVRFGYGSRFHRPWAKMAAVAALLVAGFLLIGAVSGFSIFLGVSVIFAIYALFDPALGQR